MKDVMKVVTSEKFINQNVTAIQEILRRSLQHYRAAGSRTAQIYAAFVDCKTGAIVFSSEKGRHLKAVRLQFICLEDCDEVRVELLDEMDNARFSCEEMSQEACQMLEQTTRIFNFASKAFSHTTDVRKMIEQLAQVQFQFMPVKMQRNIVQEAWYNVDRFEAEKLLKGCIAGTYLFRKDEYAAILEKQLSGSLNQPVECLTLTFIGEKKRISDLTLVKTNKGWQIYNDDPELTGESFASIEQLLEMQSAFVNFPLLHLKAA